MQEQGGSHYRLPPADISTATQSHLTGISAAGNNLQRRQLVAETASPISIRPPPPFHPVSDYAEFSGGGSVLFRSFTEEEVPETGEEAERRKGSGNRWPRQETAALLNIRSERDADFRNSALKGPLWDDVSRKLAELGYAKTGKKCKEKSEPLPYPAPPPISSSRRKGWSWKSKKVMSFFKELFERGVKQQEAMQQRLLEAIEKREVNRILMEEAWKRKEMARLDLEYELMARERAVAAKRDAAVISFLQKLTAAAAASGDGGGDETSPASSRWPKAEVNALIKLRSWIEGRNRKRPTATWEEISMEMQRLGYSRSSKRCKEKWENINKYYKKVKESSKKRSEDAKTCPYFHELEALHCKKQLRISIEETKDQL